MAAPNIGLFIKSFHATKTRVQVSYINQPTKDLTEGGDLREAQVDVPQSM